MDYRERFELKEYRNEKRLGRRIFLMHVGLLILMVSFVMNFWYLQAVRGDAFEQLAENNRLRKIPVPPTRGVILDRDGEVLASTRPALNLVLRREDLRDLDGQLQRLSPILGIEPDDLRDRYLTMQLRPAFEPLVLREDVQLPELARIESRREMFPSVEVHQAARRSYPQGRDVAHALGYIGEVSNAQLVADAGKGALQRGDIVGKAGIERVFDDLLRGRRGYKFVSVNNLGRRTGRDLMGVAPLHGRSMQLTLDLELQTVLSTAFGDEAGAGVFMDPWSGEILAMVSAPSYDPNDFVNGISHADWEGIQTDDRRPLHNRIVASYYAPGSTFKVVMAIAGLETGTIDETTQQYCNGSVRIYGKRRLCWRRGGHGWVDVRKALTHSCNVYFYKLGQALGIDAIHEYGSRFRLGQRSGVDLTGESTGVLPSREWKRRVRGEKWYPGDTVSVAIGQGLLAVTPMQMVTMISGVATGGTIPYPHLELGGGDVPSRTSISAPTMRLVQESLESVVREGTGRRAALPGIQVAGKTGTAQLYKHSAGIDADLMPKEERDHAWFIGYAPAERPEIAFAVIVEHGGHGGSTAAPIARQVLEAYFEKTRSPPSSPEGETEPRSSDDAALTASARRTRHVGPATPR